MDSLIIKVFHHVCHLLDYQNNMLNSLNPKLNRREIKMFEQALAGNKIILKCSNIRERKFQNVLECSITFYVGRGKLTHQSYIVTNHKTNKPYAGLSTGAEL